MTNRTRKTKSGDDIQLYIDEVYMHYIVRWNNLCGYSKVDFSFDSPSEAESFFNSALDVDNVDVD